MNITKKILDIVNIYFPEDIPQESKKKREKTNNDAEIALVIAAAIHKGAEGKC